MKLKTLTIKGTCWLGVEQYDKWPYSILYFFAKFKDHAVPMLSVIHIKFFKQCSVYGGLDFANTALIPLYPGDMPWLLLCAASNPQSNQNRQTPLLLCPFHFIWRNEICIQFWFIYTYLIFDIFDKYIYSTHKQQQKSQSKVCLHTWNAFECTITIFKTYV